MRLTCAKSVFSVTIDKFPTVLLCKGSEGLYYCYRCNNCEVLYACTQQESKLQNEWKRHSLSCYKPIINNLLKENENKLAKECCNGAENIWFHVVGVHARYVEREVISMDVNSILNKDE